MLKIESTQSSEFASYDQETFSSLKRHGWPRSPWRHRKSVGAVHSLCTVKLTNSSQYIGYRQRRNYSWTVKGAEESGRSLIWVTVNDSKLGEPQNIYSFCNRIIQAEFYTLDIVSRTHDTFSGFHAVNSMTKSVQFTRLVWVPLFVYFAFIWR